MHFVLATESGIPADSFLALSAVPLGVLIFLGLPYLLLRSNIGTKRAYLVLSSIFFGFMMLISLFWAFGAPGTPALTGPTNLPGQPADEYQPVWVPFAGDSIIAGDPAYAPVISADDFGPVPEGSAANVATGVGDIQSFFGSAEGGSTIGPDFVPVGDPGYALAENGRPVIKQVFAASYVADEAGNPPEGVSEDEIGQPIPESEEGAAETVAYAFFDAGNPVFPAVVFTVISLLLFAIHAALLYVHEVGAARETRQVTETEQRVPAGV